MCHQVDFKVVVPSADLTFAFFYSNRIVESTDYKQ